MSRRQDEAFDRDIGDEVSPEAALRTCLRDLVGLLALPAMCHGRSPTEVFSLVVDALSTAMPVSLTWGSLTLEGYEAARVAGVDDVASRLAEVRAAVEPCLRSRSAAALVIEGPFELGPLRALHLPLGVLGDVGSIVLASSHPGFPRPLDGVVARAGCTLALSAVENARLLQAARDADRRKDEFLAMLAHELRNPLGAVAAASATLRARREAPQLEARAHAVLDRQVSHMTRLLDDLLDVGRITRGRIELRRAPVDLAAVLQRAVDATRPLIDAQRHALTVSLPPEPVVLDVDATRVEQVFANLLTNAAKYTEPGGRITLTAAREGATAVVSVRDTGVGIAPDALRHVFDLFVQTERTLDRAQGGLGVGLTIVRRLVELHDGRVEARSEGHGRGSEFVVRLPIPVATGADPRAHEPPATTPRRTEAPPTGRRRVLIIEDNIDIAEMMAEALGAQGYAVEVAHDGAEGVRAATGARPDVVLLDLGLPGIDGFEVARRLRSDAALEKTLLIAISGYGQGEDRRRSHAAGFDAHLVKPVDFDALFALLAR